MRFFVTYDADKSAGISAVLDLFRQNSFAEWFKSEQYDESGTELAVVLMCRQLHYNFKQRIRHSRKDNALYIDVMLPLAEMEILELPDKTALVAKKMLEEIPPIISRYPKLRFDIFRFAGDLRNWFESHHIISDDIL